MHYEGELTTRFHTCHNSKRVSLTSLAHEQFPYTPSHTINYKARFLNPTVLFANPGRVRLLAASAAAAAVSTSRMEEGKEEEEGREHFENLEHPLGARTSQLWTIDVQARSSSAHQAAIGPLYSAIHARISLGRPRAYMGY